MLNISLIGCGAIGTAVLQALAPRDDVRVASLLVSAASLSSRREALAALAPGAALCEALGADTPHPDLLVECAGHGAIVQHVLPALQAGIPCVLTSVGALAAPGLPAELEAAARAGGTRVELLAGAVGAIDALAAARHGGLEEVVYTGRKPPLAWMGTPAQEMFDLPTLGQSTVIFEGTAREAAAAYPKNANVAATLALAGVGFEQTRVRLVADPGTNENVHHVMARGTFGQFELILRGKPLASNPKTSSLTVYSVLRAIDNHTGALVI